MTFFQFDREESDEKTLRKKIGSLLEQANTQQLQQVHKLIKAFLREARAVPTKVPTVTEQRQEQAC